MLTVLVLVSLVAPLGLCMHRLLRPMTPAAPETTHDHASQNVYPESMTAELDPADEEHLAFLADQLWPEDEYLELECTTDDEEESGGSGMRC